jgi:hypothetical protein
VEPDRIFERTTAISHCTIIPAYLKVDFLSGLLIFRRVIDAKDNLPPPATTTDLSAHTPMMQQYRRMTFPKENNHWHGVGLASEVGRSVPFQRPSNALVNDID